MAGKKLTPFDHGELAAKKGISKDDNPYRGKKQPKKFASWNSGHDYYNMMLGISRRNKPSNPDKRKPLQVINVPNEGW